MAADVKNLVWSLHTAQAIAACKSLVLLLHQHLQVQQLKRQEGADVSTFEGLVSSAVEGPVAGTTDGLGVIGPADGRDTVGDDRVGHRQRGGEAAQPSMLSDGTPCPSRRSEDAAQEALPLTLVRSDSTMITASIGLGGLEDSQDVEAVTARLRMVRHGGARRDD
jgi:hypothetical protein